MSDVIVGVDSTDHLAFFCPDCDTVLTIKGVETYDAGSRKLKKCTQIHHDCERCGCEKGPMKFYWHRGGDYCVNRTDHKGTTPGPNAAAAGALKREVSQILIKAVSGQEPRYRLDGCIRWGLVEREIYSAIDAAWLPLGAGERVPAEPPAAKEV